MIKYIYSKIHGIISSATIKRVGSRIKKTGYIYSPSGVNSSFYLPYVENDLIQKLIALNHTYYEKDNLDFVCKKWQGGVVCDTIKDSLVLDVGANIGNHSLYYLNECNAKGVICFEPVQDTYNILKKNIEINGLDTRAKLMNVAVGISSAKADVGVYDINNIGGTTIELTDSGNIDVVSIDELNIQERVGLIKMDVEGFEIPAIKGAMKTISRYKPYLSIEIRESNFEEACQMLSAIGYNYLELDKITDYRDCLFYMNK